MNNVAKVLDLLENHLPAIDDEFYEINAGGCGVMAKLVAEQLDLLMINYDIVCLAGWGCDYERMSNQQVNDMIDINSKDNIPNSHVLIQVDGRIFDSEGEQFMDDDDICAYIDHPTVIRMIETDCWNHTFDRDQTEAMREYTKKMFDSMFGQSCSVKQLRNLVN